MREGNSTPETLLREAEGLAAAGKKGEARQLIGDALRLDDKNIEAWRLLAKFANTTSEEIFCLKRIVHLDPSQAWAGRRIEELSVSTPAAPIVRPAETSRALRRPADLPARRRRRADPAIAFFWTALIVFGLAGAATIFTLLRPRQPSAPAPTQASIIPAAGAPSESAASDEERCQKVIDEALQSSDQGCERMGPDQVCYGNITVNAQLAPGAAGRFEQRGDIIDVDSLLAISVAPLDPAKDEWGLVVFKLAANLPRTLPGQNVTFIVSGNTSLANASGNMQAFYFSSRPGQVACERLPLDGLLVTMPQGAGMSFSANGADITLLGVASLTAHANEQMKISLMQGSAGVTADGQTQFFGAGQEIQVPLGGPDGLEPAGPPSAPTDASPDALALSCALLNAPCGAGEIQPVDPSEAQRAIALAMSTATPEAAATPLPTATPASTATGTPTLEPSLTSSIAPTDTPSATLPVSESPAPLTHTPSATTAATETPAPTSTFTASPVPPALALSNFVALGQEGVWLESNCIVHSGDVGANTSSPGPYLSDNEEVVIGNGVVFENSSSRVAGDSVRLKDGATIFDTHDNTLTIPGSGAVNGSHYSPLTLPVVASLPAAPAFTVGTQDVTVGGGQTLTLSAGEYDRFLAHNDSTITFSGGVYTFSRWDVRVRVTLYFAAPAEIRIAERMDTDQNTFIGPAPASGLTARDIRIVVAGSNGNSGSLGDSPKAAEIGRNNTIVANVYAPNGTLFIRTDTDATGAFIAKWLHVGQRVGLTLESGF